jgi:hypothetical protein
MVVYALLGGYDYEGQSLLGLYASRELAVAAYESSGFSYDYAVLERREVGSPAGDCHYDDVEYLD